ncbi:hypothetical protein [Haloferax profundi]|nr:hypothetical protein [Haloferax profundi]
MKAQVAVAEAYKNGSSKAEAQIAGRQAVADYYATKQVNLIEQWNVTLNSFEVLRQRAINESAVGDDTVRFYGADGDPTYQSSTVVNETLVNGSTYQSKAATVEAACGGSAWTPTLSVSSGGYWHENVDCAASVDGIEVTPPDTNYDTLTYVVLDDYESRWDRIVAKQTALNSEVDNFVNATWTDFESGAINASDVISANTAMFEYGTEIDGNESLYASTAALAMMGFDTPNLNSSGLMNVTYNNVTYQGLVLARSAPNDSWTANTTYNASNITGPVFIATADGRKIDITGQFTVDDMTAKDGSKIQSQNTTKYVYKTVNTTQLLEMQQEIENLREEVEAREQSAGGSSSGSGLSTEVMGGLLLAGAAAVLLIQREGKQ